MSSGLASGAPLSDILEKKLDFPQPVQWKAQGIEISLIGVAWGPANSPEMISKSHEDVHVQKAEFYPDRPYVLGLNFRARVPNVMSTSISAATSGLGRVKNVEGDIEAPMELTKSGFVPFSGSPGVYDVRFDHRSSTTEYWDFFPFRPIKRSSCSKYSPLARILGPSKATRSSLSGSFAKAMTSPSSLPPLARKRHA
jgi:hypothetical protein